MTSSSHSLVGRSDTEMTEAQAKTPDMERYADVDPPPAVPAVKMFPQQPSCKPSPSISGSVATLNGVSAQSVTVKSKSSPMLPKTSNVDVSELLLSGNGSQKAWMMGNHNALFKSQKCARGETERQSAKSSSSKSYSSREQTPQTPRTRASKSCWDMLPCKDAYLPYFIAALFCAIGCGIGVAVYVPLNGMNTDSANFDLNVRCSQFTSLLYLEIQRSMTLLMAFTAFVASEPSISILTLYSFVSRLPLELSHIDRVDYLLQIPNANFSYPKSAYNVSIQWYNGTSASLYPAPQDQPVYYPIIYSLAALSSNYSSALNFTGYDAYTSKSRHDSINSAISSGQISITNTSRTVTGERLFFMIAPVTVPLSTSPFTQLISARFSVYETFSSAMELFQNSDEEGVLVYSSDVSGNTELLATHSIDLNTSMYVNTSFLMDYKYPFSLRAEKSLNVADKKWMVICFKNYAPPYMAIGLLVVILLFTIIFTLMLFNYMRKLMKTRARARAQGHQLIVVGNNALAILNAISDPLLILDKRGRIIDANDLALDLLGYTLDELLHGQQPIKFSDVFIPKSHLADVVKNRKVSFSASTASSDFSTSGARFAQFSEASDEEKTDDKCSTGTCRQRGRPDRSLAASPNDRASAVSDYCTSNASSIKLSRQSTCTENGDPALGGAASEFFNETASADIENARGSGRGTEHRFRATHCEVLVKRKDGTAFEADVSSSVSMYGKHWLQVVLFRDITSKIKAARDLKAAKNAAEHANRQKSEFLGFICHEIRNPIHAINGICEIMLTQPNASIAETDENIRTILGVSDLMHTIVSDVLDLNKLRSGKVLIEQLEIDFFSFVETLLKSQRAVLYQKKPRKGIGGLRERCLSTEKTDSSASSSESTIFTGSNTLVYSNSESYSVNGTDLSSIKPRQHVGLNVETTRAKVELAAFAAGCSVGADVVASLAQEDLLVSQCGPAANAFASGKQNGSNCTAGYLFPCYAVTDPTHLQQIIINLIGNSVKFTSRGHIHLCVTMTDYDVEAARASLNFKVSDTGIGFDPERVRDIINPYSQATVSIGREFGGTGLGLSIVNDLVKLIGKDDMKIKTEVNVGTEISFTVDFHVKKWTVLPSSLWLVDKISNYSEFSPTSTSPPSALGPVSGRRFPGSGSDDRAGGLIKSARVLSSLSPSTAVDSEVLRTTNSAPLGEASASAGYVLVVEDNKINQILAAKILVNNGFKVLTADDGIMALSILEDNHPEAFSVVLMDVVMPRMDGRECTRIIRERGWTLPVVACTANAQEIDKVNCLREGFSEYLTKPLKQKDLISVVNRMVNQLHPSQESPSTKSP